MTTETKRGALAMKTLKVCFALTGLLTLGACASDDDNYEDYHRRWWQAQHREEVYERKQAYRAHRAWCEDHPDDESCMGWYHR
jgi:hypothetical protein